MTMTKQAWNPEAFREAVTASDHSYTELAIYLRERGLSYGIESLRSWGRPGSPGPRHTLIVDLLREILPKL